MIEANSIETNGFMDVIKDYINDELSDFKKDFVEHGKKLNQLCGIFVAD